MGLTWEKGGSEGGASALDATPVGLFPHAHHPHMTAEIPGSLVQMIGCVMVLKEGNHIKFRHKAGIGIFILQKYCGIGLGRQLMEYAIENARKTELEQLKLGVFDDNVAAIRLYEKLGFREWGREPHAFKLKDGSYRDEIQMVLFLS